MRIIAEYREWGYRRWGFLPTFLEIKDLNLGGRVNFLLDTGAGETMLSEKDGQRIGLDYKNFPKGRDAQGVGGKANTWKIDKEITLYIPIIGREIYEVAKKNIEVIEESTEKKVLPSVLGLEFLEELDFKLVFDMPTKAISLEI